MKHLTRTNASGVANVVANHRTVDEECNVIQIVEEQHNILVLRRPLPPSLKNLEDSDLSQLHNQVTMRCQPGDGLLATIHGRIPATLAQAFTADVAYYAQLFADVTECTTLGIRIAASDHPMCPRFHVDRVLLRGVITYVGPSTQYLANHDVDRAALGVPSEGAPPVERANAIIWSAQAGDLVLLKGEAWPGNKGLGAVHRSPPMPPGMTRLVVTFDALAFD